MSFVGKHGLTAFGDIPCGFWELHGCVLERASGLFSSEISKDPYADVRINLDGAIENTELKDVADPNQCGNILGVGIGALAGLRLFGCLGAVAGAVAGQAVMGTRHEMTLDVKLKDGRRFVALMDKNIHRRFQVIQASAPIAG